MRYPVFFILTLAVLAPLFSGCGEADRGNPVNPTPVLTAGNLLVRNAEEGDGFDAGVPGPGPHAP